MKNLFWTLRVGKCISNQFGAVLINRIIIGYYLVKSKFLIYKTLMLIFVPILIQKRNGLYSRRCILHEICAYKVREREYSSLFQVRAKLITHLCEQRLASKRLLGAHLRITIKRINIFYSNLKKNHPCIYTVKPNFTLLRNKFTPVLYSKLISLNS